MKPGSASPPAHRVRLMGVVNVTPDSFSDGGEFLDPERAIEHGLALVAQGADLLDVGGESTRPGAQPLAPAEETRRVLPVVAGLATRAGVPISIDTLHAEVARAALEAGATIVNDVSAGRADERMLAVVAERGAGFVAMHMQGSPRDMQRAPHYADVVAEVREFLAQRLEAALAAGVPRERIWLDPGIGFGKTLEHNLALLRGLRRLAELGAPLLVGVSRKSFVAAIEERAGLPRSAPLERAGGTLAASLWAAREGAAILRVHEVAPLRQALAVEAALAEGAGG
ncbi:MAG: dihydropteroate synthase [Planctomycetes bacterium]|nr:dihydropteroate synthase [Planctomycetota bacterium]